MTRTYMVQISLQNSGGKVVFSGGVPWNPPWALTGVKVPWSLKGVRLHHVKNHMNSIVTFSSQNEM